MSQTLPTVPQKNEPWTFRRVMWATLVLVGVALAFWLIYRFDQVALSVFIAVVIGSVIRPAVTWLYRRGLPRTAGVIAVYLSLFALLMGFVLLVFPLIAEQATTIVAAVPGYYQGMREWMVHYPNPLLVRLSEFLPAAPPGLAPIQPTEEEMLALAGQAADYLASMAKVIFIITAILLLAFHWTLDGPRTVQSLLLLVPMSQRGQLNQTISEMSTTVGYYLAGQVVLCLSIAIMALVAYLLIGLPNALVLALIAGVMEAVPMIGPLLGAIPAAIIALAIAPSKFVWVVIATLIIQQLENTVLVPRVMRKAVGVNPFVTLLAIFGFSTLFGFAGALIAVPAAAIAQILFDRFVFHPAAIEPEISEDRDYASRLRYEVQNLAKGLRKQVRIQKEGSSLQVKQLDQVMDEIETMATDLDALLAQTSTTGAP